MDQRSTVRVVFSANVAKHARVTGKVDRPSITENPCLEERIEPVASAPRSALPKGRRVAAFQQLMCCVSRDGMSMALSPSFGSEGTSTRNHVRSEEHTSELQSLMRISYAVFCLKKQQQKTPIYTHIPTLHTTPTI